MSEELINDDLQNETISSNIKDEKSRDFTPFEQKMMKHGWNPEGELSAEDWIDNGFKVKNKKLDSLFYSVEHLKNKLEKQERDAHAKVKAELEKERIRAIQDAD